MIEIVIGVLLLVVSSVILRKYTKLQEKYRVLELSYTGEKIAFLQREEELERATTLLQEKTEAHLQELSERLVLSERVKRLQELEEEVVHYIEKNILLEKELSRTTAQLEEEKKGFEEKASLLKGTHEDMQKAFSAISLESLQKAQETFFSSAKETFEKYQTGVQGDIQRGQLSLKEVVSPLKDALETVKVHVQDLEKSRIGAYAGLQEHLKTLSITQEQLQLETKNLAKALRTPNFRGKWGEVQLRRVVELAGMVEHCDFIEQETLSDGTLRPDLIVQLPNKKTVVIDAKAPLQAYLEGIEAETEEGRKAQFRLLAKSLKKHITQLGDKSYWKACAVSLEFVVLFLPGDSFFSAALLEDPGLIEFGITKKVLLATPTTLIALLKAIAYGWQEAKIAAHAEEIAQLGRSLYERLTTMTEHIVKLKKSIEATVSSYNKFASSYDTRVLVAARRFEEMGVVGSSIDFVDQVEERPKTVSLEEAT